MQPTEQRSASYFPCKGRCSPKAWISLKLVFFSQLPSRHQSMRERTSAHTALPGQDAHWCPTGNATKGPAPWEKKRGSRHHGEFGAGMAGASSPSPEGAPAVKGVRSKLALDSHSEHLVQQVAGIPRCSLCPWRAPAQHRNRAKWF